MYAKPLNMVSVHIFDIVGHVISFYFFFLSITLCRCLRRRRLRLLLVVNFHLQIKNQTAKWCVFNSDVRILIRETCVSSIIILIRSAHFFYLALSLSLSAFFFRFARWREKIRPNASKKCRPNAWFTEHHQIRKWFFHCFSIGKKMCFGSSICVRRVIYFRKVRMKWKNPVQKLNIKAKVLQWQAIKMLNESTRGALKIYVPVERLTDRENIIEWKKKKSKEKRRNFRRWRRITISSHQYSCSDVHFSRLFLLCMWFLACCHFDAIINWLRYSFRFPFYFSLNICCHFYLWYSQRTRQTKWKIENKNESETNKNVEKHKNDFYFWKKLFQK